MLPGKASTAAGTVGQLPSHWKRTAVMLLSISSSRLAARRARSQVDSHRWACPSSLELSWLCVACFASGSR